MGGQRKATKLQSYLSRTGNHATKPRRTGDNSDMAERGYDVSYTKPATIRSVRRIRELEARREILVAECQSLKGKLSELNTVLSQTLPLDEFKKLKRRRIEVGQQQQQAQVELNGIKQQLHREGWGGFRTQSFEEVFVACAKRALPKDVLDELFEMTNEVLDVYGLVEKVRSQPEEE